jgi:hypothetical protein
MSTGVTGEKPKKPYQQLGPDVTIENMDLDSDKWADEKLREAGKSMTPAGKDYLGSIAVHWYATGTTIVTTRQEMDVKQQFCVTGVADAAIATGISALQHTFARNYLGQKLRSTDKKDKR